MACMVKDTLDFFHGKKVFVTGHSGFKGSWLCAVLTLAGAEVTGFSLPPAGTPNLFTLSGLEMKMNSIFGDIRDYAALKEAFDRAQPEIVIHMAAQPIVRTGYREPVETYATNVMGTVHILECIRQSECVRSFLNVTTDKVYENKRWVWGYREEDTLNGYDPYSNSKSCSELVTDSYRKSFFLDRSIAVSTARAGNVIGGGDFATDRIIPDCVRAVRSGVPISVRNPDSVRPYQHVLDPLAAYLLIIKRQFEDCSLAGCYNIGPESCDCITTRALVDLFCEEWGCGAEWKCVSSSGFHEDSILRLDCSKMQIVMGWKPRWNIEDAVVQTVAWTKAWLSGTEVFRCMKEQIVDYFKD